MKKQKIASPQEDNKQKGPGAAARNACLGLVGAALQACVSAQQQVPPVRPASSAVPPSRECPAGSVQTMKEKLGISIGDYTAGEFPIDEGSAPITVRESTTFMLAFPLGKLVGHTVLSGRLIMGQERIYGHFTQARLPNGKTFTVCIELTDRSGALGVDRKDPGGPSDSAVVFSTQDVRAVDHFEE
ncbi:MAG: hypothetical protein ACXU86_15335 [Archangium sp.]